MKTLKTHETKNTLLLSGLIYKTLLIYVNYSKE